MRTTHRSNARCHCPLTARCALMQHTHTHTEFKMAANAWPVLESAALCYRCHAAEPGLTEPGHASSWPGTNWPRRPKAFQNCIKSRTLCEPPALAGLASLLCRVFCIPGECVCVRWCVCLKFSTSFVLLPANFISALIALFAHFPLAK